jgi:hypothetical protein
MRYFRLNLSAQTPANGDIKNLGRNPATVKMAIIIPDCVVRVICHTMAYWTTIEPNIDNACPVKNNAVFFFQFISITEMILLSAKLPANTQEGFFVIRNGLFLG